jgi:hypothetical protein
MQITALGYSEQDSLSTSQQWQACESNYFSERRSPVLKNEAQESINPHGVKSEKLPSGRSPCVRCWV